MHQEVKLLTAQNEKLDQRLGEVKVELEKKAKRMRESYEH